jgi:hypothetical protein
MTVCLTEGLFRELIAAFVRLYAEPIALRAGTWYRVMEICRNTGMVA